MLASDAFFPFADGPEMAIDAGVTAIIQPGGSIRDAEVIAAADERGVAMVFTGAGTSATDPAESSSATSSEASTPRLGRCA